MGLRKSDPVTVYFMRRADGEGPIKIGASQMPTKRLAEVTHWASCPLEILATLPGDAELEERLHAAFEASRLHGEWFEATPKLLAVVAQAQAGALTEATLPPKAQKQRQPLDPLTQELVGLADGLDMSRVLAGTGVALSTWQRWRNGTVSPRLNTYFQVKDAVERHLSLKVEAA